MKHYPIFVLFASLVILSASCKKPESDTQSPNLILSKPVAGDTILTNNGLLYIADGSDNTLISQLTFRIKANQQFTFPPGWSVRYRDTSAIELVSLKTLVAFSKTVQGLSRFATGSYNFSLAAVDVDGNFKQLEPITLFFQNSGDSTYPDVTFTSIPTSVAAGESITIAGSANDNRRLLYAKCELKQGSNLVQAVPTIAVSGNSASISYSFSTAGLVAGNYTLRTEVADSVHNVRVDLKTIQIQ